MPKLAVEKVEADRNERALKPADKGTPPGSDSFKTIPAGSFNMGGSGAADSPLQSVMLEKFEICDAEVTFKEWKETREWALSSGYELGTRGIEGPDDAPVVQVNWYDVIKWCNALSERRGLTPCYYTDAKRNTGSVYRKGQKDLSAGMVEWRGNGFRLPTEAEWEKAARGGKVSRRFPNSDVLVPEDANYGTKTSKAVRSFLPNGYGLFDMAGNVWEWCWDWSGAAEEALPQVENPTGPQNGTRRVVRGGGWDDGVGSCCVSFRNFAWPDYTSDARGFRIARSY